MLPVNLTNEFQNPEFISELKNELNLKKLKSWHNYNSTLQQQAYIIDLNDLNEEPAKIISTLFTLKKKYQDQTFVAVPTAGWKAKKASVIAGFFSNQEREKCLLEELSHSNSLSEFTTAKNASLVLRASREAQKMKISKQGNKLKVTPGVRITDADKFLFDKGYALPPNMPTLHVASLVGASANGCYGPAKNYASMTTDILKMKVITPRGKQLTLSDKVNTQLFKILKDCHLGTCFVKELTLKIEPKFLMKRHDTLFQDVNSLRQAMYIKNPLDNEHFIAMYVPVDIDHTVKHFPRIRITNFERTNEKPTKELETEEQKGFYDFLNWMETEAGEPLIDVMTKTPLLRKLYPFFLKTVALKTYGTKEESFEIDWSARIAHIFGTYTDLPIYDINWLIQVEDTSDARALFLELLDLAETKLKKDALEHEYPILNAFSRYLKGVCYPLGEGGVAPTAVEKEHQSILSFEFVTYSPLAETKAFKELVNIVVNFLEKKGRKYNYHPGKNIPDTIRSLNQIFTDPIRKQRLKNFQEAVITLHGGVNNIEFSSFLTPQKKEFIGLKKLSAAPINTVAKAKEAEAPFTKTQEKDALHAILKYAEEDKDHHAATIKKANKHLNKES